MKRAARGRAVLAVACAAAIGVSARAEQPPRPVKPGELFGSAASLEVHAPAGEGWVVRESATELLFGRPGATTRETTIATVSFFELPENESASEQRFLAFIRKANEADLPPERFSDPLATYAHSEARGLPCVHYNATALDKLAPGGALPQAMVALYCRYPLRAGFGLALVYSQRATVIDADLAQQAHAFFEGVRMRGGARDGDRGAEGAPPRTAEEAEPADAPRGDTERRE
jgi:hypothetical protein